MLYFATPSNISKDLAPSLIEKDIKVIDLSGDFRLADRTTYKQFYGETAAPQEQLKKPIIVSRSGQILNRTIRN